MDKYVTLLGTEQVQNAASSMRSSAEQMQRAADSFEHSLFMHRQWMDDWLARFENALAKQETK